MQPSTSARTSSSVSGVSTTNGYSTRQSVASVTCATRARPSKAMLSFAVWRASVRTTRRRSAAVSANDAAKRSTAARAASISRATLASRSASPLASGAPPAGAEQCGDRRRFRRRRAPRAGVRGPALVDLGEPVAQRVDQRLAPLRIVEQVVLQVRVALDDPDVAQHLEEHPRRASGAPLAAQLAQQLPHLAPEQADDDLAVGERRVVVRNLAQPRRRGRRGGDIRKGLGRRVHRTVDSTAVQHSRGKPPRQCVAGREMGSGPISRPGNWT